MGSVFLNDFLLIQLMPGFYCNMFLCGHIADTLCIVGYLFYV